MAAPIPKKPRRLARRVAYDNPWMKLFVDRVEQPGGRIVPEFHVLKYPRDSTAAIVTGDRDRILMVRVYRYPTDTIEWEIPVGMMEPGETAIEAARREALEEGGVETSGHRLIHAFHPVIGVSDIVFHVVACRLARQTRLIDTNEIQRRQWMSPARIRSMIRRRVIRDGYTLTALLFHFFMRGSTQ